MIIKKNIYLLITLGIMIGLIGISFYQWYQDSFSYAREYYIIEEECYNKKNMEHEYCEIFKNEGGLQYLNSYIENQNPKKVFDELDVLTTFENIVLMTPFQLMQTLSALLIIFTIVGLLHAEYSSGMFKNYLLKRDYKKYLKKFYTTIFKVALIVPLALIIIFLIVCLITKFNFNPTESAMLSTFYSEWKNSNILPYLLSLCLLQYMMSVVYGCIALLCIKQNKNILVSISRGYIMFIVLAITLYIPSVFFNISTYVARALNILGYWFYDDYRSIWIMLPVALGLLIIFIIISWRIYSNKEDVIIASEKQNA